MTKAGPENPRAPRDLDREVGRRIRSTRHAAGISQTALADAIGVTFQQVQKYEKGVNRVAIGTLVAIAETLGAPLDSLIPRGGAGAPETAPAIDTAQLVEVSAQLTPARRKKLLTLARALLQQQKAGQ